MAKIKLSWTLTDKGFASPVNYELFVSEDDGLSYDPLGSTKSQSMEIDSLKTGIEYLFAIAIKGSNGKLTPWADRKKTKHTIKAQKTLPPQVENLSGYQEGDRVILTWDEPESMPDLKQYEVRLGSTFPNSKFVGFYTNEYVRHLFGGAGTYKFFVKAQDFDGNLSANAASVSVTTLDIDSYQEQGEIDVDDWDGTESNVSSSGATMTLAAKPTIHEASTIAYEIFELNDDDLYAIYGDYWHQGVYEHDKVDLGLLGLHKLLIDETIDRQSGQGLEIWNARSLIGGNIFDGAGNVLNIPQFNTFSRKINIIGDESPLSVEFWLKYSATNTSATPADINWTSYKKYKGGEVYSRWIQPKIILRSWHGFATIEYTKFKIKYLLLNRKREGRIVFAAGGPHAINYGITFLSTPSVVANLENASGAGGAVRLDNVGLTSAQAYVYDDNGSEITSGTLNWAALGI